jgi:hypothetical protein
MTSKPQNCIARTLAVPENVRRLTRIARRTKGITRKALAEKVCRAFDFRDGKGRLQTASCMTALRAFERKGIIKAAATVGGRGGWKRKPRGTGEIPPVPADLPDHAGEIGSLKLVLVDSAARRRVWNELLLREHPQGDRIITGRQLRYLVESEHGILGAIGVSAAALHLDARDRWIGWDWPLRRQYLEHVVCLSRLLVRPGVTCRNLASRVLGLFCRTVAADMEREYGVRPWLIESFVDTSVHTGACYRAANWLHVGETAGRGRHDTAGEAAAGTKDIYLYCLEPDFRRRLGLPSDAGVVAIQPGDGLDGDGWAEREFGDAPLGDGRLGRRLVSIAAKKAANPTERFLECANGKGADMQGYYRFIEHPDEDAVSMQAILRPHVERTVKRIRTQRRVLCPQDSSDLDFTNLKECDGLGRTGTNQHGAQSYGLRLHSMLALTEDGLPLGVLSGECLARTFRKGKHRKEQRRNLPIEEKESYRWLKAVQACEKIAGQAPGVRLVCMMDREGDIFEVFHHWQKTRKVELLVRASQDRCGDGKGTGSMFQQVRVVPACGEVEIFVRKRKNRMNQSVSPEATLTVRFTPFTLQVPKGRILPGAVPIQVWIVHAVEENPPPDTKPIEWFLISTEPVEEFEKACQCLREYACRWRIEDWHKVLKSGCSVEEIIAEDAQAIKRIVAINMVIAWRILLMTLLGRKSPDLPPQTLFSDIELRVLRAFAASDKLQPPDTLQQATVLVGKLGGYRARRSDPPPGTLVLWRGHIKLHAMCMGVELIYGTDSS